MFEITRYESERRVLASGALAVGLALMAAMFLAIAPDIISQVDLEAYAEALPPAFSNAFDIAAMGTVEGFLATELYQFGWVILLGLYLAYSAAGLIAGDVERDRMDLLLANPVSRRRVVVEKFLSLLLPILVVNVVVGAVVYAGAALVGEPLAPVDVVAVHALSVPYLLTCAAIGLLLSVLARRESVAQRGAAGVVFGLFMLETLLTGTDYEPLARLSPTWYYDPMAILVESSYDLVGAALLLVAAAALVALSARRFTRMDVR
ncbi:ABC transporter permease subunit [Halobium salinum]|uniref:ABC transporter permease subunit n=1 Tax=Halobium salinum TaxID=1364940 RepID=A0ABD5PEB9_9EURY|nr:ABC transporter permease subunit [Halobium salinum]